MSSAWDFNAPQYLDFSVPVEDDEDVENFFDIDHETGQRIKPQPQENFKDEGVFCNPPSPRKPLAAVSNNIRVDDLAADLTSVLSFPKKPQAKKQSKSESRRSSGYATQQLTLLRKVARANDKTQSPSLKRPRMGTANKEGEEAVASATTAADVKIYKDTSAMSSKSEGSYPIIRPKQAPVATSKDKGNKKPVDFVASLRHCTPKKSGPIRCTVPQEFSFATNKRKRDASKDKFISMAEQIKAFQFKTPDRFRSHVKKDADTGPKKPPTPQVTCPQSPKLHCKYRERPIKVLSQQQKEELEVEEMKKYKFKATPFNEKLFQSHDTSSASSSSSLPIHRKSPTKPIERKLHTAARRTDRHQTFEEPKVFKFQARPVPEKILKQPVGIGERKVVQPTKAKTPPFMLKERESAWEKTKQIQKEKEEQQQQQLKKSVPKSVPGGSCNSSRVEKKPTVPQPFSFEQRDIERFRKKEEKIREELEKEKQMREFHATLLPPLSPRGIPAKAPKSPTKPEPFKLAIDIRGQMRAEKWKNEVEEEMRRQREAAQSFKAQPCNVVHKPPFVPEVMSCLMTVPADVQLKTAQRSQERQMYDEQIQQIEAARQAETARRKALEEERERAEVARMRQEAVHHAQPVRHFKPVEVKPSDKPLTSPHSPKLLTKQRATQKQ